MAGPARSSRIVIDFENGGFDVHDTSASLHSFEFGPTFTSWDEVWLFRDATSALIRGFYYPPSAPERYGIPRGQGPRCVLIDNRGDQLWLGGASCGTDDRRAKAAIAVLAALSWSAPALADYAEMHFYQGDLVSARRLGEYCPRTAPGTTFVHAGRIVCRMELNTTATTPDDVRDLWALSTQPHGWLGRPTSLTLYDNRAGSQAAGHQGCHLIATGESGRELWWQFPEPDTFGRLAFTARAEYIGSFTQYEAIKAAIFRAVGMDITAINRTWRDVILAGIPNRRK